MHPQKKKKIIRLLGVGFDSEDNHIRITNSDTYDVLMGSEESHQYLHDLIQKIDDELKSRALALNDLTPDEFRNIVDGIVK